MAVSKFTPPLTVTGRGRVRVPPDRTVFSFGLDALTPTVDGTQRAIEALRERLVTALAQAGIEADQVHTGGPWFHPQHDYEHSRRVFKGIRGSEQLVLRIPYAQGRSTEVLRALAEELQHVSISVSHVLKDPSGSRAEALRAAVADAQATAQVIAAASGVNLTEIAELSDCSEADEAVLDASANAVSEAAPRSQDVEFDPAEISVEAKVKIVWAFRPPARRR